MPQKDKQAVWDFELMRKLSMMYEAMNNLSFVTAGLRGENIMVVVPASSGAEMKHEGSDIKQVASSDAILKFIRDPHTVTQLRLENLPSLKIQDILNSMATKNHPARPFALPSVQISGKNDGSPSLTLTMEEALNSSITTLQSWVDNDSRKAKEYLVAYWTRRYGQGSPAVQENAEWYDARTVMAEKMLIELKELKALSSGTNPLSTEEAGKDFLWRLMALGGDLGYFNAAHTSAISSVVSHAFKNKNVKNDKQVSSATLEQVARAKLLREEFRRTWHPTKEIADWINRD